MIEVVVFLSSLYLLNFSYQPVKEQLTRVTTHFKTLEDEKQYYVVKNLLKACYLCFLVVLAIVCFGPYLFYGLWPNTLLRSLASMYVSNDIVGLYRVKGLKTSTRLHHYTTFLFLMLSWTVNFQESKIAKLLFLYTFASALTFPVNAYLGLRYCYDRGTLIELQSTAYYVYAVVCFINWALHLWLYDSSCWAYYALILLVVYDDIVLLKWLYKQQK
jgi:hypothetical protein